MVTLTTRQGVRVNFTLGQHEKLLEEYKSMTPQVRLTLSVSEPLDIVTEVLKYYRDAPSTPQPYDWTHVLQTILEYHPHASRIKRLVYGSGVKKRGRIL